MTEQELPTTYHAAPATWSTTTTVGLSLRDWFAGLAMQGKLMEQGGLPLDDWVDNEETAHDAYLLADLMVTERDKQPENGND